MKRRRIRRLLLVAGLGGALLMTAPGCDAGHCGVAGSGGVIVCTPVSG